MTTALSIPTQGIIAYENIAQAKEKGSHELFMLLFPTVNGDVSKVHVWWCVNALVEQIRLRDEYILKCLKDMGIEPAPLREDLPNWDELTELENGINWNVIDEAIADERLEWEKKNGRL